MKIMMIKVYQRKLKKRRRKAEEKGKEADEELGEPQKEPQTRRRTSSVTITSFKIIQAEPEPQPAEPQPAEPQPAKPEEPSGDANMQRFGNISPSPTFDDKEEEEEEEEEDDSIKLSITKEEANKFIKNNFDNTIKFLRSEDCKHLKKEISFARGSVGSFLIRTSISNDLNKSIKTTIKKMAKANKCVNLILNNTHAVYVYTVLIIFKEIEIPKGNEVKNKGINESNF